MKPLPCFTLLLSLLSMCLYPVTVQGQKTFFEHSGGKETPTYQETITYYQSLAAAHDEIKMVRRGKTDSGEPLHLVLVDLDKSFNPHAAHRSGKTVLLINNGIHPGEPDGIDASMILVRELMKKKALRRLLENTLLAIIPCYNIGGALNRNHSTRANQNGPATYGFRGNAQNYDLNRDFIKMDTRNAHAFAEIFHELNPDIFIDTHVSNGADYQYRISHLITQHNKIGSELGHYIEKVFTPQLEKRMEQRKEPITPYVSLHGDSPDQGFSQFMDYPRYSTGYTALFQTLGMMIETHMLKPYAERVQATYRFLESVLEITHQDGDKIKDMRQAALAENISGKDIALQWELDKSYQRNVEFRGYTAEMRPSRVTGQKRLYYNRKLPYTKAIPYYNRFKTQLSVKAPQAYLIPQGWVKVIEHLEVNGVQMKPLPRDTTLLVETYRIKDYETYHSTYEGHYPHYELKVAVEKAPVNFRKGDYVIMTDQPAGRFIVAVLEPQSVDSYFTWNFFDTVLQQKEYFSAYVFEEVAEQLLAQEPTLKADFEKKKAIDPGFAEDAHAQLDFIYKRSPHYETAHQTYPVYRWSE